MSQGEQTFAPFYDVERTYEDNYEQGPFGAFGQALREGGAATYLS